MKAECAIAFAGAKGDDMGAFKTARRGAMCAILGIRVTHDEDARMLGDVITPEQIADLKANLKAVGGDERKFLDFAQADKWEEIRTGKLPQLQQALRQKAKARPQPRPQQLAEDGEPIPENLGEEAQ